MAMVWLSLFKAIQLFVQDADQEGDGNLEAGLQTTDTNQLLLQIQSRYERSVVSPGTEVHVTSPQQQTNNQAAVLNKAIKFAGWVIGLTFDGILSIYSGILGNQTGLTRKLPYRACTLVMLVTVLLGVTLYLAASFHPPIHRSVKIIMIIKHITLGLLVLTVIIAAIPFLSQIS